MKKQLSLLALIVSSSAAANCLMMNSERSLNNSLVIKNHTAVTSDNNYSNWNQANGGRIKTITNQVTRSKITKFQPYLDGGLTSNNDIRDLQKFVPDLSNVTLAFVQQAQDVKNAVDLTVAGIPKANIDYTDNFLANNVYIPLAEKQKLSSMVISYGGANAYSETNPWSVALKVNQGDKIKAQTMLESAFLSYSKHIADLANVKNIFPTNLDFDIEGGSIVSDLQDIKFLFSTLAHMKSQNNSLKLFNASITLPVLPTGLTSEAIILVNNLISIWFNAGLDISTLPLINLMTMDYGEAFFNPNDTNFSLVKSAVDNTKLQIKNLIATIYNKQVDDTFLYPKMGVTPMIGINDIQDFVFTLEDAKEVYNWANSINLGVIRMWSVNDDSPIDLYGALMKTLFCHGLNYLNEYDFAKAFSGDWDGLVKNPYTSPNQPLVPPVPQNIQGMIKTTYLNFINNASFDTLLNLINKLNKTKFTYQDIRISEITTSGARFSGRGKYTGIVYVSYSLKHDMRLWVNSGNYFDLGLLPNDNIVTIQERIFELAKKIDTNLWWIDWTQLILKKVGINTYSIVPASTDSNNPFTGATTITYQLFK